MGKGSRARPFEVDKEKFSNSWDRIFGKKDKKEDIKEEQQNDKLSEKTDSEKTK